MLTIYSEQPVEGMVVKLEMGEWVTDFLTGRTTNCIDTNKAHASQKRCVHLLLEAHFFDGVWTIGIEALNGEMIVLVEVLLGTQQKLCDKARQIRQTTIWLQSLLSIRPCKKWGLEAGRYKNLGSILPKMY